MKQLALLLLLGVSTLFFACKDNSGDDVINTDFTLTFKATYDGQPLEKYKDYPYENYVVSFSRFNTFLSDISLMKGNEEVRLSEVEWVDFTPDTASTNKALEVPFTFNVPEGEYTGLRIGFGVKPELNAQKPSLFPAGHPLARELEYWLGWHSYIFTKIEGQGDSDNNGQADVFMAYHCGSDAVYRRNTYDVPIKISESASGKVVEIDIKKLMLMNGQLLDLKVPYNQFTSNNSADVTIATMLMDNFANAVTIR